MTDHFLNTRETTVLTLRFGLEDGRSRSLEDTAQELGPIESQLGGLRMATRERIRQIEAKALRKITRAPEAPTCCHDCINIQAILSAFIKSQLAEMEADR